MPFLECLSLDPEHTFPGAKVQFTAQGGYEYEQEKAKAILEVNKIYTVAKLEVDKWCSYVELTEYPGQQFNTTMFINWE